MVVDVNEDDLKKYYKVCEELLEEASKVFREGFRGKKKVQTKANRNDLVTETDKEIEQLLIGKLQEAFPDHRFIGEESVAGGLKCELTDLPTWIIDPVDGTMNFVHSLPLTCISIALWINKQPYIGFVVNPVLNEFYSARRGMGAYLNGERIQVAKNKDKEEALICTELGTDLNPEKLKVTMKNINGLVGKCHGLRSIGSAAVSLAFVASGCLDVFCHMGLHCWDLAAGKLIVEEAGGIRSLGSAAVNMATVARGSFDCYYEYGIHAWDMAAGCLLVEEAGGCVVDSNGGPFDLMSRRVVCASSEKLAKSVAVLLEPFELERD